MLAKPKRFVIIANARSGSTFFKNLLRSHQDIICFGEILNKQKILWDHGAFNDILDTDAMKAARADDPVAFVDAVYAATSQEPCTHIGFKSLYYHYSYDRKHQRLLAYLLENEDIGLIHLKRRNLFKMYCSMQIAQKRVARGKTMNAYRPDDVEDNISITVDPLHCLDFFRRAQVDEAKIDAFFAQREPHQVVYEELAASTGPVMRGVLAYLGARPRPMTPSTFKVRRQPIEKVVTNYDEVAATLCGNGYGARFAN
jgi:LPS sulfotransferase NodH